MTVGTSQLVVLITDTQLCFGVNSVGPITSTVLASPKHFTSKTTNYLTSDYICLITTKYTLVYVLAER